VGPLRHHTNERTIIKCISRIKGLLEKVLEVDLIYFLSGTILCSSVLYCTLNLYLCRDVLYPNVNFFALLCRVEAVLLVMFTSATPVCLLLRRMCPSEGTGSHAGALRGSGAPSASHLI
jgi:hypothetical protein